ncbi:glycosyltransferase family 2 protein [Chryseobacterium oryzae]|uniref:Glycosyltransferase family 2 protein n=1 Tax=Chryseobacterium oryzae TaxID=2929799 RepID=A0ABY4BFS6_9FLAO|nr:glycosyltransferase family 2 protein [Chryseobacterium oryzae]UOE38017.1 glycosyltransferase family 2 protein [Chryseobacterium oryzae]
MLKKFSILIAHYNNFEYFKDCYQSIITQTYQNFEVVLVDDCSSDHSYEKIKELTKSDSRFRLFQNDENKGVGFTKRKCVELSQGDICGFVDPDDAIKNTALEISVKNHTENNVVTYSQFYLCDSNLQPLQLFQHSRAVKNRKKNFFNIFLEANHFFTFKRLAYEKTLGIDSSLTSAVDQDLYLKLYETGNFTFIKEPLYYYRLHEKGVSQESSKKEKLNNNWQQVILNTAKRRNIKSVYGKKLNEIENLPLFLKTKQNNLFTKIKRKFL